MKNRISFHSSFFLEEKMADSTTTSKSLLLEACTDINVDIEIIKDLIEKGVDINLQDADGWTALFAACNDGNAQLTDILLNADADPNISTNEGTWEGISPLMRASQTGNHEIVKLLIQKGADVNKKDQDGWTALHWACDEQRDGHDQVVDLLLQANADVNICSTVAKLSPLMLACDDKFPQAVKSLLDKEADVNLQQEDGKTALYIACDHNEDEIVEMLLSSDADPNICTNEKTSPLIVASQNGYGKIVQSLLKKENISVDQQQDDGQTALFIACDAPFGAENSNWVVNMLLDAKADPNICTNEKTSPLIKASQHGYDKIMKNLLQRGANIDHQDEGGRTALYVAINNSSGKAVDILLGANADPNLCNNEKKSPLMIASEEGYYSLLMQLLEKGAEINKQDETGWTALYYAVYHEKNTEVDILINANADVNICTMEKKSPLMSACEDGYYKIVKQLLRKGADVTKRDGNGQTAFAKAKENRHDTLLPMLIDANKGNKEEFKDQDLDSRVNHLFEKMVEMQDTIKSTHALLQAKFSK